MSLLLPTVHPWPEVRETLETVVAPACREGCEILLLDGHGAGLSAPPRPPVRWLRLPGADVFALRAHGLAAARGEIVAILEDHCVAAPDWCRRTLAAHHEDPSPALIGPVANHPDSSHRAVDRANFLLTLGPYAPPLRAVEADRLPVPTNLSLKRAALPVEEPAAGWLEYEGIGELHRRGRIGVAAGALLEHRQSWGPLRAPLVHFHSGRAYGATVRSWPRERRRAWRRSLLRLPGRLLRITRPALERGAGGAPPTAADRGWLLALVLANTLGQAAGSLAGAGDSRARLS